MAPDSSTSNQRTERPAPRKNAKLNPDKEPGVEGGSETQKFILAIALVGFICIMGFVAYLLTYGM